MVGQEKIIEKLKKMKMNYLKQERGSILVLTVVLLPIMFAFLGFGYDFGNIYMHKARLQNVADAAALAGARAYLDSQANDNKDEIDGTVDRDKKRVTSLILEDGTDQYTSDKNGRDEYTYEARYALSAEPPTITHGDSKHPDADKAADAYIFKNIINLGQNVKSDKWSHYAINSDNVNTNPKTFYRIGLYEEVPLYFLPIIKSVKSPQIVRAGAIALVEEGTGGGDGGDGPSFSIFDNLFTYTDDLFTQNTLVGDQNDGSLRAGATFKGTIAYTHLNGLTVAAGAHKSDYEFFSANNPHDINNDKNKENHLYDSRDYPTISPEAKKHINDGVTNTFYNTTEYLEAFRKKLSRPHVEVKTNSLTLTGDGNSPINSTCMGKFTFNGNSYRPEGLDFYRFNSSGDVTFNENGQTYKIIYHKFINSYGQVFYLLCGKDIDDDKYGGKYYLLNKDGKISNAYIYWDTPNQPRISYGGTEYYLNYRDNSYVYGDQYWQGNILPNDFLKNGIELLDPVPRGSFVQETIIPPPGSSNVYHFSADFLPNPTDTNIFININTAIPEAADHSPIYIIIDESITQQVQINSSSGNDRNFNSGRPIVVVSFGKGTPHVNLQYATVNLTLYMPNADYDASNFHGTFNGNIIARYINIASGQTDATWNQENFLDGTNGYTDTDVQEVTQRIENRVNAANSLLETAKITEDGKTMSLKEYISKKLSSESLKIEVSNLGDMDWYQNLSYKEKQDLYVRWKALYESKKGDTNFDQNLLNLLWPWNEHFDAKTKTSSEGPLRLINFLREYNVEGSGKIVDPFIYLTLEKEDAY